MPPWALGNQAGHYSEFPSFYSPNGLSGNDSLLCQPLRKHYWSISTKQHLKCWEEACEACLDDVCHPLTSAVDVFKMCHRFSLKRAKNALICGPQED